MRNPATLAVIALAATAWAGGESLLLGAPEKALDGKDPIDVEVGHATPSVVDWDGDGKRDLLLGQFGGGRLRFYRNVGTDGAPRLRGFEYVQAGGKDATVPVS